MDPIVVTIVVAYLALMLAIGWWSAQRISSNDDFLVAGRRLGPLMLAGSLAATEVGGGSSLGVTEKAYGAWGLSAAWYVLAMAITFGALTFVAPRLRAPGVRTVPEFFRGRYGAASGLVTALILILPMVGLTAVQLIASATVLSVMSGFDYTACVFIVTIVVTIYSVMGGLWSVAITDVVQWVLIVIGSALVIPFALSAAGGVAPLLAAIPEEKMSPTAGIGWKTIVSLSIMYFASFSVGQESMQRYFAARDERAARIGSIWAGLVYVVYAFIPALIGVIAFGMVQMNILDSATIEAGNLRYVLPQMAATVLPSVITGLLFAGLISATMSSADSNLLAAGALFSNDIYRAHLAKDASDARVLAVTRGVMVVVAVFALFVALLDIKDIVTLLMFSFTLRAGGIFIPYVVGHFDEEATPASALSAVVVGSAVVIIGEQDLFPTGGFEPVLPAIGASAVTYFLVNQVQRRLG